METASRTAEFQLLHPSPGLTSMGELESQGQLLSNSAYRNENSPLATSEYSLIEGCAWKDGGRGGVAHRQKPHEEKKKKNRLDTHRPPHGKSWTGVICSAWGIDWGKGALSGIC